MKTTKTSRMARVLVTMVAVCVLVCGLLPMSVFAANDAVNGARDGVLQVNLVYTDDSNTKTVVNGGSGFLINDNTLLTCCHCVTLTSEEMETLAVSQGKSVAEIQSRLSCTITIARDMTIPASISNSSSEMDFAILRLSSSLQGCTPLAIRSSATVKQTETVYAIGFPNVSALLQSYNTYTSSDATITSGVVNKVANGINVYSGANTDYIQTSCNLDYGNSGGPMLDENGYVIGISQGIVGDTATEYFNAVAIDQVTEVLDKLGVVYQKADDTTPAATEAPVVATEAPTEAPAVETPVVVPETPTVAAPVVDVPADVSTGSSSGSGSTTLILIIAAIAVVVIILVVVIVLATGKKKPAPAAPAHVPPVRPNTPPVNNGFAPPPTYPVQGAGETTVLSQGAGETTVLSHSVNGGTLIRKRTGESVSVNTEQFIIGRERKGVNYCISDNSSISRNHVKLTVRGGITYLSDLNAANGTFVNGVKVMPRQEVALKNGDKITLADEDLEYRN